MFFESESSQPFSRVAAARGAPEVRGLLNDGRSDRGRGMAPLEGKNVHRRELIHSREELHGEQRAAFGELVSGPTCSRRQRVVEAVVVGSKLERLRQRRDRARTDLQDLRRIEAASRRAGQVPEVVMCKLMTEDEGELLRFGRSVF